MMEDENEVPLNEEEKKKQKTALRHAYGSLFAKVLENEQKDEMDMRNLKELIEKNDELYNWAKDIDDIARDARITKSLAYLCKSGVEGMSANTKEFKNSEFADRLIQLMRGHKSEEGDVRIPARSWINLGKMSSSIFSRTPSFKYLYGSLSLKPPERKVRKPRETMAKNTKDADLRMTQATEVKETEVNLTQTERMVVDTGKSLKAWYNENDKKPIDYFRFVTHPTSFSKTIENIFHCSFLIKEGRAKMTMGENGLPLIYPIKPNSAKASGGEEAKPEDCQQVIMNVTMNDWKTFTKLLNIKEPMIPDTIEGRGGT